MSSFLQEPSMKKDALAFLRKSADLVELQKVRRCTTTQDLSVNNKSDDNEADKKDP